MFGDYFLILFENITTKLKMAKKKLTYKEAVEEIEKIMAKLENEEIDIDELSKNVKRAGELITFCKQQLRNTEEEIEHILDEMNE